MKTKEGQKWCHSKALFNGEFQELLCTDIFKKFLFSWKFHDVFLCYQIFSLSKYLLGRYFRKNAANFHDILLHTVGT